MRAPLTRSSSWLILIVEHKMKQKQDTWISRSVTPPVKPFNLSASVEGKVPPFSTATWPDELRNGDFTVKANGSKTPCTGDGQEEWTWWAFDFRNRLEWHQILTIKKLDSVILRLTMRTGSGVEGDVLRWVSTQPWIGGEPLNEPFKNLNPHEEKTVTVNLLDYWTREELVHALMAHPSGVFQMEYADDALLLKAELTIAGVAYVTGPRNRKVRT
jgi:hypothetical protein